MNKPYTPTPFNVTVTVKTVDDKRCFNSDLEFCNKVDPECFHCYVYGKLTSGTRLPECLAAEQKAKEQKP